MGANGAGKSTILDGLAILISWAAARLRSPDASGRRILDTDIHNERTSSRIEITCQGSDQGELFWGLTQSRKGRNPDTDPKHSSLKELNEWANDARDRIRESNGKVNLPLFVYYPVKRSVLDIPLRIRKSHAFDILEAKEQTMADQPNILLIMSDQHSPHFLGCTGEELVRTPALDHLAQHGVRFASTYCGNPLCVPSRMTFLTSRHCSDIGVWTNQCRLSSDIPTFVHHLVNAGYETLLCGRMHFTGLDQRHGFECRLIGDVHAKLEHIPRSTTGQTAEGVQVAGPGRTAYSRYDEEVTHVCCQFIESWDASPGNRPFFLNVGYVLPHCPYVAPKRLFDEYIDQVAVPQLPDGYLDSLHPFMQRWRGRRGVDTLTDDRMRVARAAYYGLVTYMDELIGDVLLTLSKTSFGQDTLVIYTSDHGDMAGEHRMWWKSSFYEGSVGVPLIISWPGRFADGRTISSVTSLLDIGPTLVELASGTSMPSARGHSLLGFLGGDGDAPDWPDTAFSELGGLLGDPPGRMIRRGPWKLNHYHGHVRPQLFHIESDPGEWHDLTGDARYTAIREELLHEVRKGWSGNDVLYRIQVDHQARDVLAQYQRQARVSQNDPPDRWTAPDNCNIFPEE